MYILVWVFLKFMIWKLQRLVQQKREKNCISNRYTGMYMNVLLMPEFRRELQIQKIKLTQAFYTYILYKKEFGYILSSFCVARLCFNYKELDKLLFKSRFPKTETNSWSDWSNTQTWGLFRSTDWLWKRNHGTLTRRNQRGAAGKGNCLVGAIWDEYGGCCFICGV